MQTKRKDKPHDMSEASVDDVTACMCVNVHASVFICVPPFCVCVCVLLSLCLLFGNAKHDFRPNVASWTHESEFKDPSCGHTCSYQLVMKFNQACCSILRKKDKDVRSSTAAFLVKLCSPKQRHFKHSKM